MAESRTRIVVAEDDEAILELVVTRLELAGYQAFIARDGYRALEAIYTNNPHGVVLDVNMPGLDGLGVLRSLRANAKFRTTPVMMLTARKDSDDVLLAMSLGAKDYLTKPFEDAKLLARVARLTTRRSPARRPLFLE